MPRRKTSPYSKNAKIALGLIGVSIVIYVVFQLRNHIGAATVQTNPAVLGRSYPLQQADIPAGAGGTIVDSGVSVIVSEGTFGSDVYLRVDRTARGNPISINGLWQVGDMWNVRVRNHENDDEISYRDTKKKFILAFPYTQEYLKTDQGVRFDENNLKLIRGETATGPWTVLNESVIDTVNKRISVVTNLGGHYTVGGGFYAPDAAVTSGAEAGVGLKQGVILKENEIVVTITPTPNLTSIPTSSAPITDEREAEKLPSTDSAIGGAPVTHDSSLWGFLEMIISFFKR